MIGPVEMWIPAEPKLSRVVRLAASAVASMGGFDVALIDDVKLVVSEIVLALIEQGSGAEIHLSFVVDGLAFRVSGSTSTDDFDLAHSELNLCRSVLASLTVSHNISYEDGTAQIRAELCDLEA